MKSSFKIMHEILDGDEKQMLLDAVRRCVKRKTDGILYTLEDKKYRLIRLQNTAYDDMTVAEKREHDKQLSGLAWSIQFIKRSPAGTSNNQRKVELTYNDKTLANTAVQEVGRIRLRNHNVNVSALIVYKKHIFVVHKVIL